MGYFVILCFFVFMKKQQTSFSSFFSTWREHKTLSSEEKKSIWSLITKNMHSLGSEDANVRQSFSWLRMPKSIFLGSVAMITFLVLFGVFFDQIETIYRTDDFVVQRSV